MGAKLVMVSPLSRSWLRCSVEDCIMMFNVQVVDRFLDVTPDMEDGESLQYFQQRSSMMVNIVRRYSQVFLYNNIQCIIYVHKWQQDEARDGERGSVHLCGERLGRWTKGQHGS